MLCLDYSELLENYEQNMLDKLRNFSTDSEVLDTWVPSNDFAQSILSLIESVWLNGNDVFELSIGDTSIQKTDIQSLIDACVVIADVSAKEVASGWRLIIQKQQKKSASTSETSSNVSEGDIRHIHQTEEHTTVDTSQLEEYYLRAVNNYIATLDAVVEDDVEGMCITVDDGVTHLTIVVDQEAHRILSVSTDSDDMQQGRVLYAFASILIGLPIREAIDHGAMYFLSVLTNHLEKKLLIPGVISCSVIPAVFSTIQKLMNQVGDQYKTMQPDVFSGYNEFDRQPNTAWQDLSKDEKINSIEQAISEYTATMTLPSGDIQVLDVEYDVRILVGFTGDLMTPSFDKGVFLMDLERLIRHKIESRLELYMEPRRDQSKLRRLT